MSSIELGVDETTGAAKATPSNKRDCSMRKVRLWVGISVSAAMVAVGGGAATAALTASAPPALRCTGTFASPGRIASGTYSSITVAGYCLVPRVGTIAVTGPLAVAAGGELSALSG